MARRRRSRRHQSHGMFAGLRKHVKAIAGVGVGLTGLGIALSPVIASVNATTGGGTQITQSTITAIPGNLANTYGVNYATGTVDFGKLLTLTVGPVLGGLLVILGLRAIVKRV